MTRQQELQAAYNRGFEKAAQAAAPLDLERLQYLLRAREDGTGPRGAKSVLGGAAAGAALGGAMSLPISPAGVGLGALAGLGLGTAALPSALQHKIDANIAAMLDRGEVSDRELQLLQSPRLLMAAISRAKKRKRLESRGV